MARHKQKTEQCGEEILTLHIHLRVKDSVYSKEAQFSTDSAQKIITVW
jgi:hypothetical protein